MFLHSNIHELIGKAEKLELNSSDEDSPYLKHCVNMVTYANDTGSYVNPDMETIGTTIDYRSLFTQYRKKGTIEIDEKSISCNYYGKQGDYNKQYEDQYLFYKLANLMSENKIIYIFMDLVNYFIQEFDDGTNESLTHSVSYVLYPAKKDKYILYYINSHGNWIKTYESYDYTLSSHRVKEVAIPEKDGCMEFLINHSIVNSLNTYLDKYEYGCSVSYESNKLYNYLHFNLQNGDNHGTCFIFPYVLWYELMFGFEKEHVCGRYPVSGSYVGYSKPKMLTTLTLKDTLDYKNIQRTIELVYMNYDTRIEHIIHTNFYKSLDVRRELVDKDIESRKANFTKRVLSKIISRFEIATDFIKTKYNYVEEKEE
jgi:hypothetical protein